METQQLQASKPAKRWAKPRSQAWWEECSDPSFPADEFQRLFRLSRDTFCHICDRLAPIVCKRHTRIRVPIPVPQRVASGLWRLVTADPLYLLSKRFGLGVSTVQKNSLDLCAALNEVMLSEYVQWPAGEYQSAVARGFEAICGIPNVVGVIYTTHISICAPRTALVEYYNKRHTERFKRPSYSMTLQATVDHQGLFTDLCLGYPGSLSDEDILQKSALAQRAKSGALAGHWVLGSRTYPLLDWLLVPYAESPALTWAHRSFNERMEEALAVAREAFSRLKARWRYLTKRTESKIGDLPGIIGACCVLHNVCERRGEPFNPEWGGDIVDDIILAMRPDEESPWAMQERERIVHELLQQSEAWGGGGEGDPLEGQELLT